MLARTVLVILLLISASFSIDLVSPSLRDVSEGDIVDLGTIGPGQTVSILIDPLATSGGIHGVGGTYDEAFAHDLPRGWESKRSKLYQNPLQVTMTADPDAPEGNYSAKVTVVDELDGESLGNVTFTVRVRVTWDVMDFSISPTSVETGPGQPARFTMVIENKGSTSDVFQISAKGPKRWEFKKPVFVPAMSSKTIYYEIVGTEEESYQTTISVVSLASSNIADQKNVTMNVRSGLLGDYKATNNGVVIFPIFETITYSLAGLISNFF